MEPRKGHSDETIVGSQSTSNRGEETIVNADQSDTNDATIGSTSPATGGLHDDRPAAPADLESYLRTLAASGLFTSEEVSDLQKTVIETGTAADPDSFSDVLVKKNAITPYQAEVLRAGKTRGLVLGNYVVLDKIGEGGMGMVFKARHRRMKRVVALKILPPEISGRGEVISRFHREVEAAAKLHHPNIAAAYDADEADGIHFLVMEHVQGPNLSSYVKKVGPLPVACALHLISQAARGLAHAHRQGVVHRDIKPGNLLINENGVVKILDMGLAQLHVQPGEQQEELTELTQSGRVMGTVDYMAPEQAVDAKNVDQRADIYSLGCTLYYLLAGRAMSPDGALAQKLLWHQTQPAPELRTVCAEASDKLVEVYNRMLAKKPEDRQQSMAEVVEQLDECLDELPTDNLELPGLGVALDADPDVNRTGIMGAGITMVERPTRTDLRGESADSQSGAQPAAKKKPVALYAGLGVGAAAIVAAAAFFFGGGGDPPTPPPAPPVAGQDPPAGPNAGGGDAKPDDPAAVVAAASPVEPVAPKPKPYASLLGWVFQYGGNVAIAQGDGRTHNVRNLDDVPVEIFDIKSIDLSGTSVRDDELARLAEAKTLQTLSLADTKVTDQGLAHLRDLEELGELNLEATEVTNAGLEHLKRLLQLRDLRLQQTAVNDQGMQHLAQLKRLENLYLSDTQVGDVGVMKLNELTSLKRLVMNGTYLTEEGHDALQAELESLDIVWDGADIERSVANKLLGIGVKIDVANREGEARQGVVAKANLPRGRLKITAVDASGRLEFKDEDLERIAQLSAIESLNVGGTSITPAGLKPLYSLASLKTIDLGSLQIPTAHVDALKNALAGSEVLQKPPSDLEAAQWVLAQDGVVAVESADGEQFLNLTSPDSLPKGPFALRAIKLNNKSAVADDDLARFQDLTGLQTLELVGAKIGDAGVAHLAGCSSLRELNLSGTKITSTALDNLQRWPSLRNLYLADTALDGEALKRIARAEGLTHLSLAGVKINDADLAHLKRLDQLAQLTLSRTPLTDNCRQQLEALPGLAELSIDGCKISDAGQEEIVAALPNCKVSGDPLDKQRLAVRWVLQQGGVVATTNGSLEKLDQLPRSACSVTKIDLAELNKVSAADLAGALAACNQLEELKLSSTSTSNDQLAAIGKIPSLRTLHLAETNVSDEGLKHLADLTNLETLDLRNTRVNGAGLSVIAKLPALANLYLSGSQLSDATLRRLSGMNDLASFDIGGCTLVSDLGLAFLGEMPQLKVLVLRGTRVGDATLARIANSTELTYLDLENTKITDGGLAALKDLEQLTQLNLSNTAISDSAATHLSGLKNLKNLSLVGCKIEEGTIASLKAALPNCAIAEPRKQREDENQLRSRGAPFGGRE